MPAATANLALADWAVLALVAEGDVHGWAVVRVMAPEGDVGRIWTCSRPRVYRALDALVEEGLVHASALEPGGQGPARRRMSATRAGRGAVAGWLVTPVEHVRDLRSALLLKLLFLHRAGADPAPLLEAQRALLEPMAEGLATRVAGAGGFERTMLSWRLESCRGALRFVEGLAPAS
jgi:DNA-binding PadR family transcriptional regulator